MPKGLPASYTACSVHVARRSETTNGGATLPEMTLPAPLHQYAYAEYVALEEHSPIRHEYIGGEIYAMAGGTPGHAALAATVLRLIGNQLPAGCRAFTSDLRVRILAADVTTYPDGAVVCGKTARAGDDALAVTNPVLLIEVTSPSTEAYDRGVKLEHYRQIESLREVIIVSHAESRLSLHRRGPDGLWETHEARAGEALDIASTGGRLAVDEVYRDGLDDA
jgi:Uma2 family endonuclease